MKIYLCGFMASGKSTLRQRWAQELAAGAVSFDFDAEICARYVLEGRHRDLEDVVDEFGWGAFRRWERELLEETLELTEGAGLFSLGGGTLGNGGAALILNNPEARLVWLKTEVEECWQRSAADGRRPLVQDGKEIFVQLYQSRLPTYQMAHVALSVEQQGAWSLQKLKELLDSDPSCLA